MEMQRVWAVYFSGTGTTEKVVTRMAKIAAEDLGAEYKTFCFNLPKDREGELSFGPGDLGDFRHPGVCRAGAQSAAALYPGQGEGKRGPGCAGVSVRQPEF